MATTLEGIMNLGRDVDDWKAALAARSANSETFDKDDSLLNPEQKAQKAIREVNNWMDGLNAWSGNVLNTFEIPSWMDKDQIVADLGHRGIVYVVEVARIEGTNIISGETLRDGIRHEAELRKQRASRKFLAYPENPEV